MIGPDAQNKHFCRSEPPIKVHRSNYRLQCIAKQRLLAPSARHHFGPSKFQNLTQVQRDRNLSTGLFAHQGIETRCQLAFACGGILFKQSLGHHQPQHPVPQKLQPLVIRARRRRDRGVRDRLTQQFWPFKIIAQPALKNRKISRQFQMTLLKKRSLRQVQKNNIERPADENKMRSARPIRFSNGTNPTPPACWRRRLSVELSRLSPIKK